MQANNPLASHDGGIHPVPTSGQLADNQTLELRADLIGASQNDAWAGLHFLWASQGQEVCILAPDSMTLFRRRQAP